MASGPGNGCHHIRIDPCTPDVDDQRFDIFPAHSHRGDHLHLSYLHVGLDAIVMPPWRTEPLRVFRYSRLPEIPNSDELAPTIRDAMDQAGWFMVLASGHSAMSRWVGEEIKYWLTTRGTDHVVIVVTEGDGVWDAATNDFDPQRSSAIHPELRGVFIRQPPILDMRWAATGSGPLAFDRRLTGLVRDIAALVLECPAEKVRVGRPLADL